MDLQEWRVPERPKSEPRYQRLGGRPIGHDARGDRSMQREQPGLYMEDAAGDALQCEELNAACERAERRWRSGSSRSEQRLHTIEDRLHVDIHQRNGSE